MTNRSTGSTGTASKSGGEPPRGGMHWGTEAQTNDRTNDKTEWNDAPLSEKLTHIHQEADLVGREVRETFENKYENLDPQPGDTRFTLVEKHLIKGINEELEKHRHAADIEYADERRNPGQHGESFPRSATYLNELKETHSDWNENYQEITKPLIEAYCTKLEELDNAQTEEEKLEKLHDLKQLREAMIDGNQAEPTEENETNAWWQTCKNVAGHVLNGALALSTIGPIINGINQAAHSFNEARKDHQSWGEKAAAVTGFAPSMGERATA